ncbi:MAG TPA: aldehyde:ferredoxin oxidoreductase [Polyangiaceae bacterium]|nr:aldehyde:ferredoxin oxidoreductase [Polyangiaceae bacterium]
MTRRGQFGRYALVHVTDGSYRAETIPHPLSTALLGGVGLGTALLLAHTDAGYDPLADPCIVLSFSPLVGTPLTTSAKFAVVAKSPLTQRLSDALSSSDFAIVGKRSGHDAIVLTGRAAEPSVILLNEDGAQLRPATHLWDRELSVAEAEARLEEEHPGYRFCVIGTAGERLVRYAGLTNRGRHAGRGGLGAVLGAMRVKAVGVKGSRPIPLADVPRLASIAKDWAARSLGPATEKYRELGTVANLAAFNRLAILPTRNFQSSTFEGAEAMSGEQLELTRKKGRGSCRSCTIGCEHFFATTSGKKVKMEYENLFALGPLCGVADPDVALAASARCDELGLDTVSAGGTIAFAMECSERGLFAGTPWEAEAAGLGFGQGERLLELLDAIGHRRPGLGALLAEGSRRAADRLGPPAPDFAPHVKGLELPGYEPRALQTMALGLAVGSRGADHNKSGAYEVDLSRQVDRFAPGPEAAALAAETEDRAALIDSLILCKFLRGIFTDLYAESAEALAAITGHPFTGDDLKGVATRIVALKRYFNEREGWTRAEDTLPKRFLSQALPDGVAAGARLPAERLAALIDAYYHHRGWQTDGRLRDDERATIGALLDMV